MNMKEKKSMKQSLFSTRNTSDRQSGQPKYNVMGAQNMAKLGQCFLAKAK